MPPDVLVTTVLNPFDPWRSRDTIRHTWREGMTAAYFLPAPREGVHLAVSVNGAVVDDPAAWPIQPADSLAYCAHPHGDSAGAIIAVIAMIALMIFVPMAVGLLPGMAAAGGGLTLTGQIVAGVGIAAGGAMVQALMPAPEVEGPGQYNEARGTYGWSSAPNTATEGVCVPVVYGKYRVTAPYIASNIGLVNEGISTGEPNLRLLLALAEGPINLVENVRLNSTPSDQFDGLSLDVRFGESTQTVVPYMADTIVTTNVGQSVDDTPEVTTTRDDVVGLQVSCLFPNGYWATRQGSKDTDHYRVGWSMAADYRLAGSGAAWTEINRYGVTAAEGPKPDDAKRVGFAVTGLAPARYEVRVRWITAPAHPSNKIVAYVARCFVEFVNEVIDDDFSYPNTALLGVQAIASGRLSGGMPVIDGEVTRLYVDVWDPATSAYVDAPADNPAWVCYDLLHNARYGGNVPASRIDHAAFTIWAAWCTAQSLTCNLYLDQTTTLTQSLQYASTLGRGIVVQQGTSFSCLVDKPADPVQLFSMGNIVTDSFSESFLPQAERANAIEVSYYDADRYHKRHVVEVQAADIDEVETEIVKQSINLIGCTNRAMAARHGQFLLNCNKYLIRTVEWEAGVDAIACTVGDVVYVQHDVPQWGYGGRVVAATATSITIDQELTLEPGTTYSVMVRHSATDIIETRTVAAVAEITTTATLTITTAWTTIPGQYDVFSFGPVTSAAKQVRIIRISRASDQTRKITAIEYRSEIYDDSVTIPDYEPDTSLTPVRALTAEPSVDNAGQITLAINWIGQAFAWSVTAERLEDTGEYVAALPPTRTAVPRLTMPVSKDETYRITVTDSLGSGSQQITVVCTIPMPELTAIAQTVENTDLVTTWEVSGALAPIKEYVVECGVLELDDSFTVARTYTTASMFCRRAIASEVFPAGFTHAKDVRVYAVDVLGRSQASTVHQWPGTTMEDITGETVEIQGTTVTLAWTPHTYATTANDYIPFRHYAIYRYDPATAATELLGTTTATTYTVEQPLKTSYQYGIRAVDILAGVSAGMSLHDGKTMLTIYCEKIYSDGRPNIIQEVTIGYAKQGIWWRSNDVPYKHFAMLARDTDTDTELHGNYGTFAATRTGQPDRWAVVTIPGAALPNNLVASHRTMAPGLPQPYYEDTAPGAVYDLWYHAAQAKWIYGEYTYQSGALNNTRSYWLKTGDIEGTYTAAGTATEAITVAMGYAKAPAGDTERPGFTIEQIYPDYDLTPFFLHIFHGTPSSALTSVRLYWDSADFTDSVPGMAFQLQRVNPHYPSDPLLDYLEWLTPIGAAVDMTATAELALDLTGTTNAWDPYEQHFTIRLAPTAATVNHDLVLKAGWNYISLPIQPQKYRWYDILGWDIANPPPATANAIQAYDSVRQKWIVLGSTGHVVARALQGYKIYSDSDQTITVAGWTLDAAYTLLFDEGQNFIGVPEETILTKAAYPYLDPVAAYYDTATSSWLTTSTLEPGIGYLVTTTQGR